MDSRRAEAGERGWVKARNLIGFWIFGLCNNFAYVVMLSAAHDILKEIEHEDLNYNSTTIVPLMPTRAPLISNCNPIGTGAILLADILPTMVIKLTAPFYMQRIPYFIRINLVAALAVASFVIVATSGAVWISIVGVICASLSAGLGEITFLALSSHFHTNSVSTWSSGTGGAGVFGALSYAGLRSVGVSSRDTLFIMIFVPVLMELTYLFLIVKPSTVGSNGIFKILQGIFPGKRQRYNSLAESSDSCVDALNEDDALPMVQGTQLSLKQKLLLIKPLLIWMLPLAMVYFAEYFINQCLYELVAFKGAELEPNRPMSIAEQYRWFQVDYQVGVFLSRSSVNLFKIEKIYILAVLQLLNIIPMFCQVLFKFVPNLWLILGMILYEGLLGGLAYVNTFYMISTLILKEDREYSIGVASVADSFGIAVAGAVAIPVHNMLCTLSS